MHLQTSDNGANLLQKNSYISQHHKIQHESDGSSGPLDLILLSSALTKTHNLLFAKYYFLKVIKHYLAASHHFVPVMFTHYKLERVKKVVTSELFTNVL